MTPEQVIEKHKPALQDGTWQSLPNNEVDEIKWAMKALNVVPCSKCNKHQAMHLGIRPLCCECYVNEGNPPADWHTVCMETYRKMKL